MSWLSCEAAVSGESIELGEVNVDDIAGIINGVEGNWVALHGVLLEGDEVDGWGEAQEGLVVAGVEGISHGDVAVLSTSGDYRKCSTRIMKGLRLWTWKTSYHGR